MSDKTLAYTGEDHYIFISYAHKDSNRVMPIIEHLQRNNFRVWYDEGITPGSLWDQNISERLKGCTCFFAFMTNNYQNSENCLNELEHARKMKSNISILYLEEVNLLPFLQMRYGRLQAIHTYKYSKEELLKKIIDVKNVYLTKQIRVQKIDLPEPFKENGKYVYVSYHNSDIEILEKLVNLLKSFNLRMWYFDNTTQHDDEITTKIKGCECFLCLMSNQYLNSDEYDELFYAKNGKKNIISIYLEDMVDPMLVNNNIRLNAYEFDMKTLAEKVMSCKALKYCFGINDETLHDQFDVYKKQLEEKYKSHIIDHLDNDLEKLLLEIVEQSEYDSLENLLAAYGFSYIEQTIEETSIYEPYMFMLNPILSDSAKSYIYTIHILLKKYAFVRIEEVSKELKAPKLEVETSLKSLVEGGWLQIDDEEHICLTDKVDLRKQDEVDELIEMKNEDKDNPKISIDELHMSFRSTNQLKKANIYTIDQLIALNQEALESIPNLGLKSISEIVETVCRIKSGEITFEANVDYRLDERNNEKIIEYCRANDIELLKTNLSERTKRDIRKNSISMLSEIITFTECDFKNKLKMSKKSTNELMLLIDDYFNKNDKFIRSLIDGTPLKKMELYQVQLEKIFDSIDPFIGIDRQSVLNEFEKSSWHDVTVCLLGMMEDKKIKYDGNAYTVNLPTVFDYVNSSRLKSREATILNHRFNNKTLEEIGELYGLTRERVRQIESNAWKKLGGIIFIEDKYKYVFENYSIDEELYLKYFKFTKQQFYYYKTRFKAGKADLEEALFDENVYHDIQEEIQAYFDRDSISLHGKMIKANRSGVEDYVLETYCKDEVTFERFIELYMKVTKESGLALEKKYKWDNKKYRTRENRLRDSKKVVWKLNRRLRYYPIQETDFTELLDTLHLETYTEGSISTEKWMNDYPGLMEKYDIRDKYELHNIVKKIIDEKTYPKVQMTRNPHIIFGDLKDALISDLKELAPITQNDFAQYLVDEYGFSSVAYVISGKLSLIKEYYNGSVYSFDQE